MKTLESEGRRFCGTKIKNNLKPWLDEKAREVEEFQETISQLTTASDRRKEFRTQFKRKKKYWDEAWWMRIAEQVKQAEVTGDSRQLY